MFISHVKHDIEDDFNTRCIILYTSGCNLRCSYCFNPELVINPIKMRLSDNTILNYLIKNKPLYNTIVITGGEPTIHNEIVYWCKKIKEIGYNIELCTNGINYNIIEELVHNNLIDFFRIDLKVPEYKYKTVGYKTLEEYNNTLNSIKLVSKNSKYEIRTTLHQQLLNNDDLNSIVQTLYKLNIENYGVLLFNNNCKTIGTLKDFENVYNLENIHFKNFKIYRERSL